MPVWSPTGPFDVTLRKERSRREQQDTKKSQQQPQQPPQQPQLLGTKSDLSKVNGHGKKKNPPVSLRMSWIEK